MNYNDDESYKQNSYLEDNEVDENIENNNDEEVEYNNETNNRENEEEYEEIQNEEQEYNAQEDYGNTNLNIDKEEIIHNKTQSKTQNHNKNKSKIENLMTSNQSTQVLAKQEKQSLNLNIDEESLNELYSFIYDNYGSKLLLIFESYCRLGYNKSETRLMKSSLFNKFLKESNLIIQPNPKNTYHALNSLSNIQEINQSKQNKNNELNGLLNDYEIDIIFTNLIKLTNKPENSSLSSKVNKCINFNSFIYGIIYIAGFVSVDNLNIKELICFLIEEYILKNNLNHLNKNKEKEEILELLEALKQESEEDVKIIKILSNSLQSIYLYYSSNFDFPKKHFKGLMNFENMFAFCIDFLIFPDILSKNSIIYYFKHKAQEISDEIQKTFKTKEELIDYSGFIDIICLIAIELPLQDQPFINRINTLIDHLSNSFGQEKIFKKSGQKIKQIPIKNLFKKQLLKEWEDN